MGEWFEDEEHWRDSFELTFNPVRLAAGEGDVDQIIALTGCQDGAVLDLCCGPGRLTIPLAARGYDVTGVDLTECLLDKARARALEADVRVRWVREDMRRFVEPDRFTLALCLHVSFGYFEDRAEDVVVLRNLLEGLAPGGTLVLECAGKESLALHFASFTGWRNEVGTTVFMRRRIVGDWNRTENELFVVEQELPRWFPYTLNLYSGQEIKQHLLDVGFSDVELYGDLAGNPYDHTATTLLAVARKGSSLCSG